MKDLPQGDFWCTHEQRQVSEEKSELRPHYGTNKSPSKQWSEEGLEERWAYDQKRVARSGTHYSSLKPPYGARTENGE